jgi:hypothetical protein
MDFVQIATTLGILPAITGYLLFDVSKKLAASQLEMVRLTENMRELKEIVSKYEIKLDNIEKGIYERLNK